MTAPFVYPKTQHVRTVKVRKLTTYRRYKRYLRKEFGGQCIYCRMPDSLMGYSQFGVEHYLPKSTRPDLETDYANLYYCCNACNSNKRDAEPIGLGNVLLIPNPCDQVMYSHLRFKQGTVDSVSKAGRFTIDLLDLNDDELVKHREDILHNIDVLENQLSSLKEAEANLKKKLKQKLIPNSDYLNAMVEIENRRIRTQRVLDRNQGKLPI